MEWIAELGLGGLAVFLLASIGYVIAVLSRRLLDDGELRLSGMARREGAALADLPQTRAAAYQSALAIRRCAACADKAECDAWLSDGKGGVPEFCPNAEFIAALRAPSR